MERMFDADAVRVRWNELHADPKHRLRFQSECVVRWRYRHLGGKGAPSQSWSTNGSAFANHDWHAVAMR